MFKMFYAEIKTPFGTSLQTLRSDYAKEYLSTPLADYTSQLGIVNQTPFLHTPEQNCVGHRKNRDLL